METKSPIIKLQNVNKVYVKNKNTIQVLKNINFKIANNSFTALSGPSGSGKTTLLKIIGGYIKPTSGEIFFNGEDISKYTDAQLVNFRRRNVGIIFQDYYLDQNLTLQQNIELPAYFANLARSSKQRTEELINGTDLQERLKHYPSELSGGQIQRAAVLRAIYLKPNIVLADEPTSNLDDKNAHIILSYLKNLQQKGHTIIIASHDNRTSSYIDSLIKIQNGEVECD